MEADTGSNSQDQEQQEPEQPKYVNSLGADQCRVMARDAELISLWVMEHIAPVPISHHRTGYEIGAALLLVDVCRLLGMPKMAYKIGGGLGYDTEQLIYAGHVIDAAAARLRVDAKIVLDILGVVF